MNNHPKRPPGYKVWGDMVQRCTNPNNSRFKDYGGRGIKVCDSWRDFGNFIADMGPAPLGCSLDRCDNDGDYTKENCRWTTRQRQQNNMRSNRLVTIDGRQMSLADAMRYVVSPLNHMTIQKRLAKGWDLMDALCLPSGYRRQQFTSI